MAKSKREKEIAARAKGPDRETVYDRRLDDFIEIILKNVAITGCKHKQTKHNIACLNFAQEITMNQPRQPFSNRYISTWVEVVPFLRYSFIK